MQEAEVAEKMAGAEERRAKAANATMDARMKAQQMAILQPNPVLPSAGPTAMPSGAMQ
jgi:hypothetical protein